jgi:putative transposase
MPIGHDRLTIGAMPNYLRTRSGSVYFFTVVAFDRRPILCHPTIRTTLRRAIEDVRKTRPFSVDGWVLMPDHLHCIWTLPPADADFSTRWSLIKRSVAHFSADIALDPSPRNPSHRKRRESTIWQRRFWEHLIRDDVDLARHLDYIHYNPVKHGHVARPIDWPYSTIHRYVSRGVYPVDWCGGTHKDWGDFE